MWERMGWSLIRGFSVMAMLTRTDFCEGGQSVKTYSQRRGWGTLARWLSWLEHCPIHQKVAGSIPSQGTYVGSTFNPQSGSIWEATYVSFSLSLSHSLSLSLFLKSINMPSVRIFFKKRHKVGTALSFSSRPDYSQERRGTSQACPLILPKFTSW